MNFVIIAVLLLSLYLRLDAFLINNTFFTDEILLAVNVLSRNYSGLFFPLDYFQSAPYLFLVLSKFICSKIGYTELCFRFIPFVSSIVSVFLFCKLSCIAYRKSYSRVLALLTFGINYQLLFYTQVFKQYSTDVLLVILTLYLILKFKNSSNKTFWISFGIYSIFAMLSSFPVFIILLSVFTTLFIFNIKNFKQILYPVLCFFTGGLVYYLSSLRFVNNSAYLESYWHKGFEIFSPEIYKINFEFLFFDYKYPILLLILLLAGFAVLYKNKKFEFTLFFTTLVYTMLFALCHIYPFERRLALFLLPVLILVMFYPLESINLKNKWKSLPVILITFVFLITGYFNFGKDYVLHRISYLRQDVKPLLEIIKNKQEEDNLYIYYGSVYTYGYYSMIKDLPRENIIMASFPQKETESEKYLIKDLTNLPEGSSYLLFVKGTWTYDKDMEVLNGWLKTNCIVEEDIGLKSARLVKIKVSQ